GAAPPDRARRSGNRGPAGRAHAADLRGAQGSRRQPRRLEAMVEGAIGVGHGAETPALSVADGASTFGARNDSPAALERVRPQAVDFVVLENGQSLAAE